MSIKAEDIQITGEPQMDPNVCKFTVNQQIYPEGSVRCTSKDDAAGSPLLEALFKIEGIQQVFVYGENVVVSKNSSEEWPMMGKAIGAAIRNSLTADTPPISPELKKRKPSEQELRERVEQVFNEQINPYVAQHGGHVEIVDVRDTAIYISFSGGCQGCAASSVTLKQGIEKLVFQAVPEVSEVVDITDHSSGTNPYYQ